MSPRCGVGPLPVGMQLTMSPCTTALQRRAVQAAARPSTAPALASRSCPPPFSAKQQHRRASLVRRAAEVAAEVEVEEEDIAAEVVEGSSWAAEGLKALEEEVEHALPPVYSLSFLWLDKNIAVAADQMFGDQRSPLTEYFMWPKRDAWEELKAGLEQRPWIGERDRVLLLNKTTEVINYWQDETKHSLEEARAKFPDCKFLGS